MIGQDGTGVMTRVRRLQGRIVTLAGMMLAIFRVARTASAQNQLQNNGQGMDTHLFRPSLDSKGLFVTNGSQVLGKNDFSFGLVIDYGNTLLRINNNGVASPQLINNSFQGTFQGNFGIANIISVG